MASHIKISDKDVHHLQKSQLQGELVIRGNAEVVKEFERMAENYNKEYRERFGYKAYQIGKLNIKIK